MHSSDGADYHRWCVFTWWKTREERYSRTKVSITFTGLTQWLSSVTSLFCRTHSFRVVLQLSTGSKCQPMGDTSYSNHNNNECWGVYQETHTLRETYCFIYRSYSEGGLGTPGHRYTSLCSLLCLLSAWESKTSIIYTKIQDMTLPIVCICNIVFRATRRGTSWNFSLFYLK